MVTLIELYWQYRERENIHSEPDKIWFVLTFADSESICTFEMLWGFLQTKSLIALDRQISHDFVRSS